MIKYLDCIVSLDFISHSLDFLNRFSYSLEKKKKKKRKKKKNIYIYIYICIY